MRERTAREGPHVVIVYTDKKMYWLWGPLGALTDPV